MTEVGSEEQWRGSEQPGPMFVFLLQGEHASQRKQRLYACACSRHIWHLMTNERIRAAVLVAEEVADGTLTEEDRARAEQGANAVSSQVRQNWAWSAYYAAHADLPNWVRFLGACPAQAVHDDVLARTNDAEAALVAKLAEERYQADLVRDIFGHVFHPVVPRPEWLGWNGGSVRHLAHAIYEDRRFADLPILADALEDAGCDDPVLLAHCRAGGPHVRGCWVIDLLRGQS